MARFYPTGGGGGADTSVVTAAAGDVLTGKVIVDANGNPLAGTMANNGAVAPSALGAGGSYTIPAGYHNGSGKVTVQSLATMTASGDATAAQILSGKKAYVDGTLITGTIESKAAATYYATTSDQTISAGQYLSGAQTIKKLTSSNLSAANIKTGVTVTVNNGNANVYSVAGTFCGDATLASAANLLSGQIAYGKSGTKYTGTMTNQGAKTASYTPSTAVQTYTIPAGYHNGSGKITINAIPSGYVNLSAGVAFFKNGAFGTLQTYLGHGGVEPLDGGTFFNYSGSDAYGSEIQDSCWYLKRGSASKYNYFGTTKTINLTPASTITLILKTNVSGGTVTIWAYGSTTKTLKSDTYSISTTNSLRTLTLNVSDLNEQSGFGFYVYSTKSTTTWHISELSIA